MKTSQLYIIFLLLICFSTSLSQTKESTPRDDDNSPVQIISSNDDSIIIEIHIAGYYYRSHKKLPSYFTLNSNGCSRVLKHGAPDLPKESFPFIIPTDKKAKVEIIDKKFVDILAKPIGPVLLRNPAAHLKKTIYGPEYDENSLYPEKLYELSQPYFVRDYKGQTILIYPFQYNPQTNMLRVYESLRIKISYVPDKNGLPSTFQNAKNENLIFRDIYQRHFKNYKSKKSYAPISEQGGMLILSHPDFLSAMQPFVSWKIQKGIPVTLIDASTIGNYQDIKLFVEDYYRNKPFVFLLLVGDAQHVPTYYKNGFSDAAYGHITGTDSYAEVIVGRFSAESQKDIETQVQRTIEYEKNPSPGDWMSSAALIASKEGVGDDNEYDYEHMQNIVPDLTGYDYTSIFELYEGSQGGYDKPGNPDADDLIEVLNSGVGMTGYIGHGETDYIYTTGFNTTHVNELTNFNKLPFMYVVACDIGNFVSETCLAETLLRATKNNKPIGNVCVMASTIDQEWDPPMAAHDEMIDILTESYENNIKHTFGGIGVNGCMLMNDEYPIFGPPMTDTWTIFGDPSLQVRSRAPDQIHVDFPERIVNNRDTISFFCTTNNALLTLSCHDSIYYSGFFMGPKITASLGDNLMVDSLIVTVTAYNAIPFIDKVSVFNSEKIDLSLEAVTINDSLYNSNSIAENGEHISFNLGFNNFGKLPLHNCTLKLSSDHADVSILNNLSFAELVPRGCCSVVENSFLVSISGSISNNETIPFSLFLRDKNDSTWETSFSLKVQAPQPELVFLGFTDETMNGRIGQGEQFTISFLVQNNGASPLYSVETDVEVSSAFITNRILKNTSLDTLYPGVSDTVSYIFSSGSNTPVGELCNFNFTLNSTHYFRSINVSQRIGLIVEDWETSLLNQFKWKRDGSPPWSIIESSGVHNSFALSSANILKNDTSSILLTLNVMDFDSICFSKKVSCEEDFDYLNFTIDDVLVGKWSGVSNWSNTCFQVTPGIHDFKWSYIKDFIRDRGEDKVYIDDIILPVHQTINSSPVIVTEPNTEVNFDSLYSYKLVVSDLDIGDSISIVPVVLPEWVNYVPRPDRSFVLSGVPSVSDTGIYDVELKIDDNTDIISQKFTINVTSHASIINPLQNKDVAIKVLPDSKIVLHLLWPKNKVTVYICDINGKIIQSFYNNNKLHEGSYFFSPEKYTHADGIYYFYYADKEKKMVRRFLYNKR